jgi:uncharacterized protein (DUF58 family)
MVEAAAAPADFRKDIRGIRRRQVFRWGFFLVAVLALLSVFSGGFFLYSALVAAGLLLLSILIASFSLVGIDIQRTLSSEEIPLGQSIEVRLTVHNKKGLSAFWVFWKDNVDKALDVEGPACHFKTIGPMGKHELRYRLHSTRRGFFRVGPTIMESSGPFGLVRRFLVSRPVGFVTVLPRVVSISKGLPQGRQPIHQVPRRRSIFEDPSRFMGMRDYRPGDSLRRIHWRATARSGKIQVKLFEPAVLAGALLAVDMGLEAYPRTRAKPRKIDPLLEMTITAAASLGEYILAGDQRLGLVSNGVDAADLYPEDWTGGSFRRLEQAMEETDRGLPEEITSYQPVEMEPAKGFRQQERLLSVLARLMPSASVTLPELLMTDLPRLPHSLVLMVFTPNLTPELTGVLGSLKRSGIETGVVWVRDPEEEQPPRAALPQDVPVYQISCDADLEQLGGQTL